MTTPVVTTTTVPATACLWFAWAPTSYLGPWGESGSTYRPVSIAVPSGATRVQITASGTWTWQGPLPANQSGPDGGGQPIYSLVDESIPQVPPVPNPGQYRSSAMNSLPIQVDSGYGGIGTNLGMLVGIWQIGSSSSPGNTHEFAIGLNSGNILVPPGAQVLFLGFHDGQQWTDNAGSVSATVTFSFVPYSGGCTQGGGYGTGTGGGVLTGECFRCPDGTCAPSASPCNTPSNPANPTPIQTPNTNPGYDCNRGGRYARR